MIKITLKSRRDPVKLSMGKKEMFHLKAVYYILIDEVKGVANIHNTYTHCLHKMNDRGYYLTDKRTVERLKKNIKVVCVEATSQDISLTK